MLLGQIAFSQINVTITGQQNPEIGGLYDYQIQAYKKTSGLPPGTTGIVIQQYIIKTLYNGSGGQVNGSINNVITQFDVANTSLSLINRTIVWGDWSDNPYDEINVTVQGYFVDANGNSVGQFNANDSSGKLIINKQTIQITAINGNKNIQNCCNTNQTYTVQSTGNSFSWSVSGGATIAGANTGGSIIVTPPINGNYSVTVIARRTGASQNYFKTATGNVTRTERSITFTPSYPNGNPYGFEYICKGVGRLMQLENQCGVSSINWIAPDCTISGQGTMNPAITPNQSITNGNSVNVYAVVSFIGGCTATTPSYSFKVLEGGALPIPSGKLTKTYDGGDPCYSAIIDLDFLPTNQPDGTTLSVTPDFIRIPKSGSVSKQINVCYTNICDGQITCKTYSVSASAPSCNNALKISSNLKITPNPSNGDFTVTFPEEISGNYLVYDLNGIQIKQGKLNKSKFEIIKLQNVRQGNYIIKVISEDKREFNQNIIIK